MYIKVTSYMYASAFLTAICAGSNPQSFMAKFSKFSIMYMRRYAVFPQHWWVFLFLCSCSIIKTIKAGGGGGDRFFLHNSKTPWDIEKKLSDFDFKPLTFILHILSLTILIRGCHSNLLFTVCHVIFAIEKPKKNLNYFQDNYLIKLKFGREAYF